MGIPAYFRIITEKYSGCLHFSSPRPCNHLFVDFNGLIHQAARRAIDSTPSEKADSIEEEIILKTWEYLNACIDIAKPSNMIHSCIDGVAPIAKMNQQRKRRFLSAAAAAAAATATAATEAAAGAAGVPAPIVWDTNAISPGTNFMLKLQTFMRKMIRENATPVLHYFSGSDDNGEGEHKMFARMGLVSKDQIAFVYGLDADLIMLSLMSHHPNIYLMREASQVKDAKIHAHSNITITDDMFVYMDIHALRVNLLKELINTHNWPVGVPEDPYSPMAIDIIESYVTLCFLMGNDFLPHIPSLSLKHDGHQRLMDATKQVWEALGIPPVSNGTISTKFFANLLSLLSKHEDSIIFKVNEDYLKRHVNPQAPPKDPLAQKIYNLSNFSEWRALYYKTLFHTRLHDTRIVASASELFIKGIFWTYHYYQRRPKDPSWFYPYNYAPTVMDLSNHIQSSIAEWDTLQAKWETSGTTAGFVSSPIQLLSILPIQSVVLLPKSYQPLMTNPTKGCSHMFPIKYPVQTYLKTQQWECMPVLPPLDIEWLQRCAPK